MATMRRNFMTGITHITAFRCGLARIVPLLLLSILMGAMPRQILLSTSDTSCLFCVLGHRVGRRKSTDESVIARVSKATSMVATSPGAVQNARLGASTGHRSTTWPHLTVWNATAESLLAWAADTGRSLIAAGRLVLDPKGYCREQTKFV
jgi:hypothetical protein